MPMMHSRKLKVGKRTHLPGEGEEHTGQRVGKAPGIRQKKVVKKRK